MAGWTLPLFSSHVPDEVRVKVSDLTQKFHVTRKPQTISFRDIVNKWTKRSDKYSHLMHKYPAKLLPYIPIFFLSHPEFAAKGKKLLDPFAGTGTVLLEGIIHPFYPMNTLGVEINPLARLIAKVKTTIVPIDHLREISRGLLSTLRKTKRTYDIPEFPNRDFWFVGQAQKALAKIKHHISLIDHPDARDFFKVCFSSIIRRSSLADPKVAPPVILKEENFPEGKQKELVKFLLREKREVNPLHFFEEEVNKNLRRYGEFLKIYRPTGRVESRVIWDDIRTLRQGRYTENGVIDKYRARPLRNVHLVITSPPYINAQKYIRTLKFEMLWLGLVDYEELLELDRQLVGTERVYYETYKDLIMVGEKHADRIIRKIYSINPKRACIVSKYFLDMEYAMRKIYDTMTNGGRFILVVGNNLVCKHEIENQTILSNIATEHIGFELEFIAKDVIRSRGLITKRHETAGLIPHEWIIVMRKPE